MNKIYQPLSASQVESALGLGTRILKYSELKNYETINDLLPNINDFVILLLEDSQNHGHWTCLMKYDNDKYYYFNSYGKKYDTDLSVVPMCIRRILGQENKEIARLLDGKTCSWNKNAFQNERSQVCGRYCILAVSMITKMGFSPPDFERFLLEKSKLANKSVDSMIAGFVPI
jgi:hypothetical protein